MFSGVPRKRTASEVAEDGEIPPPAERENHRRTDATVKSLRTAVGQTAPVGGTPRESVKPRREDGPGATTEFWSTRASTLAFQSALPPALQRALGDDAGRDWSRVVVSVDAASGMACAVDNAVCYVWDTATAYSGVAVPVQQLFLPFAEAAGAQAREPPCACITQTAPLRFGLLVATSRGRVFFWEDVKLGAGKEPWQVSVPLDDADAVRTLVRVGRTGHVLGTCRGRLFLVTTTNATTRQTALSAVALPEPQRASTDVRTYLQRIAGHYDQLVSVRPASPAGDSVLVLTERTLQRSRLVPNGTVVDSPDEVCRIQEAVAEALGNSFPECGAFAAKQCCVVDVCSMAHDTVVAVALVQWPTAARGYRNLVDWGAHRVQVVLVPLVVSPDGAFSHGNGALVVKASDATVKALGAAATPDAAQRLLHVGPLAGGTRMVVGFSDGLTGVRLGRDGRLVTDESLQVVPSVRVCGLGTCSSYDAQAAGVGHAAIVTFPLGVLSWQFNSDERSGRTEAYTSPLGELLEQLLLHFKAGGSETMWTSREFNPVALALDEAGDWDTAVTQVCDAVLEARLRSLAGLGDVDTVRLLAQQRALLARLAQQISSYGLLNRVNVAARLHVMWSAQAVAAAEDVYAAYSQTKGGSRHVLDDALDLAVALNAAAKPPPSVRALGLRGFLQSRAVRLVALLEQLAPAVKSSVPEAARPLALVQASSVLAVVWPAAVSEKSRLAGLLELDADLGDSAGPKAASLEPWILHPRVLGAYDGIVRLLHEALGVQGPHPSVVASEARETAVQGVGRRSADDYATVVGGEPLSTMRVYHELDRLLQTLSAQLLAVFSARLALLRERRGLQHEDVVALEKLFAERRRCVLEALLELRYRDRAVALAEQYGDFEILAAVAAPLAAAGDSTADAQLSGYLDRFGAPFANVLFSYYLEKQMLGRLLTAHGDSRTHVRLLGRFLEPAKRPQLLGLACLNMLHQSAYSRAGDLLARAAPQASSASARLLLSSLGKLACLAGAEQSGASSGVKDAPLQQLEAVEATETALVAFRGSVTAGSGSWEGCSNATDLLVGLAPQFGIAGAHARPGLVLPALRSVYDALRSLAVSQQPLAPLNALELLVLHARAGDAASCKAALVLWARQRDTLAPLVRRALLAAFWRRVYLSTDWSLAAALVDGGPGGEQAILEQVLPATAAFSLLEAVGSHLSSDMILQPGACFADTSVETIELLFQKSASLVVVPSEFIEQVSVPEQPAAAIPAAAPSPPKPVAAKHAAIDQTTPPATATPRRKRAQKTIAAEALQTPPPAAHMPLRHRSYNTRSAAKRTRTRNVLETTAPQPTTIERRQRSRQPSTESVVSEVSVESAALPAPDVNAADDQVELDAGNSTPPPPETSVTPAPPAAEQPTESPRPKPRPEKPWVLALQHDLELENERLQRDITSHRLEQLFTTLMWRAGLSQSPTVELPSV